MEIDPLHTELHVDETEKKFTINRVQDVEPILDYNAFLRSLQQKSDWGRHVAKIPNIFIEKWLREEWDRGNIHVRPFTTEFDEIVERKLKDPDFKHLRTDSAQVQHFIGWGE